jgi:hypothetical protein
MNTDFLIGFICGSVATVVSLILVAKGLGQL